MAPDIADWPSAEQARELAARLRTAQADAKQSAALSEQRQREETDLRAAETKLEEAQVCLERLRQEASCKDLAELPEAERRSQNRARLETELAAPRSSCMIVAAGDDLDSSPLLWNEPIPSALDASIEELEAKIAALDEELRGIEQTIGAARAALSQMNGGADAAETAEKIQTLLARPSKRRRAVCNLETGRRRF